VDCDPEENEGNKVPEVGAFDTPFDYPRLMRQGRKGENAMGVKGWSQSKEQEIRFLELQHFSPCGWKFYRESDKAG
jgi:hypothetical protein